MMHCPLRDLPNNFLDAPHSPFAEPISEQLALHIEQCNDCQQYLAKELDAASVAIRPLVSSPIHGYRILKLLGHGGHASVYLALELSTERQVALKVIPKSPDHTREGQDVWRQEILLAAQMTHPNLVRLYSVQETSNAFALVFEYLAGGTLAQAIPQLTSPNEIQHLLIGILQGLTAIHSMGILHLDLKPSNILIDRQANTSPSASPLDWIPKISDFGIARKYTRLAAVQDLAVTADGPPRASVQPIGTIAYMAPEQTLAFPELLGPPTDLFALGGILQKMLEQVASAEVNRAPANNRAPASNRAPNADRTFDRLNQIAQRCLEIDPALRYPSASAILEELIALSDNTPNAHTVYPSTLLPKTNQSAIPPYLSTLKSVSFVLILVAVVSFTILQTRDRNKTHSAIAHSNLAQWIADLDLPPEAITPLTAQRLELSSKYWTGKLLLETPEAQAQSQILHYAILQRSAAERLATYVDARHISLGRQLISQAIEITSTLHTRLPQDQDILREYINATFCAGNLNHGQEDLKSYDAFVERRLSHFQQAIKLLPQLTEPRRQWFWTAKILDELRRSRQLANWGKLTKCSENIAQAEWFAMNELKTLVHNSPNPIPFELDLRFQLATPQADAFAILKTLLKQEPAAANESSFQILGLQPDDRESLHRYLLVNILGDFVFQDDSEGASAPMEETINRLIHEINEANAEPSQIPVTVHEDLIRFVAGISSYARSQQNTHFAEFIQRRYLQLCTTCQSHFPNHPSIYVALSEAHLQSWKNHLRRDEPELAVAALLRSQAAAQQGLDIDPNHPLAYHQVTDRLKRLARFRNE